MTQTDSVQGGEVVGSSVVHRLALSGVLLIFWLMLSGNLETKFLLYGILTALVTAWACYPLLLIGGDDGRRYFVFGINPFKGIYYFFWLMWQLVLANIDVVNATVRSEPEINPRIVRFRFKMANPMGKVILANSITLTPGTVTINVTDGGIFTVHALTDGAADGLKDASGMPAKVAALFGESFDFEVLGEDY